MPTRNTKFYSFILLVADALVLLAAFTVAYIIRVKFDNRPLVDQVVAVDYLETVLLILPFWILIFAFIGLYRSSIYSRRLIEWSRILVGCFVGILVMIGWEYVTRKTLFPARLVAVYVLGAAFILIVLEREILKAIRSLAYRFGRGVSRVLLIGNSGAVSDIALALNDTSKSGYRIVAIAGPARLVPDDLRDSLKHFTSTDIALAEVKNLGVTTIIQTDLYDSEQRNQRILTAAQVNHIQYNFIPGEPEFYTGKNTVDVFLGYPMITVSQTPLIGWGAIMKRILDQILSTLLIVVFSPIYLLIIICQLIFNPGPVFYISKRLSQFSKPISLIKFRTMSAKYGRRDAAEEFREMGREDLALEYEKNRKVANDPRITTFGRFLRATSLDELPQIFNVFCGDLSLVGPRPILPQEVKFSRSRAALLHSVRSGVTGLWQVSGRSNLSFDERIELELYYAQNWSFWLDIKILFKTIAVVLFGRGAR